MHIVKNLLKLFVLSGVQYMYFMRLKITLIWQLILFSVFMLYNVFFSYRVLNGTPLEHLWYQVKAVVDHANPTHTYTLQAHTFRESNY